MWQVIETNSQFRCENTRTGDHTDQAWATHQEAQAWADETNARRAAQVEASKKEAAERKALPAVTRL